MAAVQRARVGRHRLLHEERGPTAPGGVIGPGDGRTEHRHDAVTHHLVHGAADLVRGGHQSLDHAVEDLSPLVDSPGRARGAPNIAMMPSPITWFTVPPTSCAAAINRSITPSRICLASSRFRSESSSVEPRMSAKRTVR